MRPLPLLGLVVGFTMIGWGGYALYGRFAGGPEVYWGKQKVVELTELTGNIDAMRAEYDRDEALMLEFREKVAAMPAGPAKDAETRELDEVVRILGKRDKEVKDRELLLGTRLAERDVAGTRALIRGIAFPVLGLACMVGVGRAFVRRPPPRQPRSPAGDLPVH